MNALRASVRSFQAAAALVILGGTAHAIPITNPSFELGTFVNDGTGTMVLPVSSTQITGWTVVNDQLAWIISPNSWGLSAHEGNRFLDLTAYPTGAPFGGVRQTLTTNVGETYELSYYLGTYTQRWGGPPVSITASAGNTTQQCTVATTSTASTWTECSMTFTALAASTDLTLFGSQGFQYIGLDNVSVESLGATTAVPEPASLGLLGAGFAALAARRRRGKR
jgi:hypothetical protein